MFNVKYEKPFYVLFLISFKLALAIFPHDYYVRFNQKIKVQRISILKNNIYFGSKLVCYEVMSYHNQRRILGLMQNLR